MHELDQQQLQRIPLSEVQEYSLRKQVHFNKTQWTSQQHFHTMVEVVLYEKIKGKASLDGGEWDIASGKILFIPPYALHHFELDPGETIYHVSHFNESFMAQFLPKYYFPAFPFVAELKEKDFKFLLHLLDWRQGQPDIVGSGKIPTECLKLMLTWIGENLVPQHFTKKQISTELFRPVLKYLNDKDLYSISVQKAIALCRCSRSHFIAEFKKNFGLTFNQFLMNRRLNAAQKLLLKTDLSFTEIALQLQFNDSSYFSKCFKDAYACSPREFKMKNSRGE